MVVLEAALAINTSRRRKTEMYKWTSGIHGRDNRSYQWPIREPILRIDGFTYVCNTCSNTNILLSSKKEGESLSFFFSHAFVGKYTLLLSRKQLLYGPNRALKARAFPSHSRFLK